MREFQSDNMTEWRYKTYKRSLFKKLKAGMLTRAEYFTQLNALQYARYLYRKENNDV